MQRHYAALLRIDNNEMITRETHYEFLYQLQSALLLSLREQGILTPMQHRHVDETLKQQRRDRVKWKQKET